MNLEQDVIENNKISLTEALNVQQSLSELGKKISNDDFKADAIEILIKEEIIDKGYIISDFHKYFDSNKKESPSEELWNTKKLKYFTDEFKKKNPLEKPKVEIRTLRSRENQEETKSPESKSPRSKSSSPKRGSARKCSKQFPKITDADGEVLTEMIHVKKLESNELSESAFACVRINKAEPVKGGVFTKDYIQYKIRTNPLGWEVDRNYNDFFWLRSSLQKRYPRLIIPNIPKRQNKEKFSEDSVRKRIYIFERFLNDCLTDENLKADSILCDFLSADDIDKFKNIKDKVDKLPRQTRVEDMWSHDGHLSVDLRPELSEYSKIAETYCGQTEPVLKEIRHLSKRLASEIKQVSTTIKEIGQKFELLQGFSSFYNQKISRDENSLDTIYSSLQRTFYTWGEKMQDQVNLVKKSLVCFFKYNSYENEFYREVNIRRTKLEEEYSQHKQALIAKKDKLFKQGDVNKWDLDPIKSRDIPRTELISDQSLAFDVMLYGETEDLRRKRDMYGVINSSVSREMVKILKRRCVSYQENFKNFANKQLEFANEMDLNWTSFATDMDKLKLSMSRIIN